MNWFPPEETLTIRRTLIEPGRSPRRYAQPINIFFVMNSRLEENETFLMRSQYQADEARIWLLREVSNLSEVPRGRRSSLFRLTVSAFDVYRHFAVILEKYRNRAAGDVYRSRRIPAAVRIRLLAPGRGPHRMRLLAQQPDHFPSQAVFRPRRIEMIVAPDGSLFWLLRFLIDNNARYA